MVALVSELLVTVTKHFPEPPSLFDLSIEIMPETVPTCHATPTDVVHSSHAHCDCSCLSCNVHRTCYCLACYVKSREMVPAVMSHHVHGDYSCLSCHALRGYSYLSCLGNIKFSCLSYHTYRGCSHQLGHGHRQCSCLSSYGHIQCSCLSLCPQRFSLQVVHIEIVPVLSNLQSWFLLVKFCPLRTYQTSSRLFLMSLGGCSY